MNTSENNKFYKLLPGALQGFSATIVGHPFDTLKTRMQVKNYSSVLECASKTIQNNGLMSLYRGINIPMISHVLKRTSQFYWFDNLKSKVTNPYLCGGMSSLAGLPYSNPLQIIKINMQGSNANEYKNTLDCIKQHYNKYGLKGFYRGTSVTFLKDIVFGASFLGNYYTLKYYFGGNEWYHHFLYGSLSQYATWCVFIPIDYFKSRIQREKDVKIYDILKEVKNKKVSVYRGLGFALSRQIAMSGIAMTVYEISKKYIECDNKNV